MTGALVTPSKVPGGVSISGLPPLWERKGIDRYLNDPDTTVAGQEQALNYYQAMFGNTRALELDHD